MSSRATIHERAMRLTRTWRDHPVSRPHFVPADLPFVPVDLQTADLTELIASCDIDHGVAPVPHTRGGTAAGRARRQAARSCLSQCQNQYQLPVPHQSHSQQLNPRQ